MAEVDAALAKALADHQAGAYGAAADGYRKILDQSPNHTDALHLLGLVLLQTGEPAKARALVDEAIAIRPDVALFHANRGRILEAAGASDHAGLAYADALARDPDQDRARQGLEDWLAARGRADADALIADRAAVLPYAGYQAGIERKRASAYMDYPSHVHLETMAKCNAACTFCPYPDLERQGEKMDDALIAKVIGDLADIPQSLGFQLSPFKVSEPFLDVRLFDILGDVNTRLPNASLTLTTNGAPVTEKTLTKLSAVRRLGYLWISFNDHREEAYEATMRLPYARTIERLDLIHRWRADGRLPCRVVLSRVGDGSPVDMDFQRWVAATYPAFGSSVMPRGDWIGQVADAGAPKPPNIACSRWFELSITATGVVAHCCMDGHAEHPIGDVRERHALQIYNDPHYRRLREATATRMDASPCDRCSFL